MANRTTTLTLSVAGNFSSQLRSFAQALDQADKAAKGLGHTSKQTTGVLGQMGGVLGKLGLGISLAAVTAGVIGLGKASIKLAMDMEQTEVAFKTLIGSSQEAEKHLSELRDFAATTPFQFTELTQASKKMMAFGFETEQVIPMMRNIGDAVAALGGSSANIDMVVRALGQLQAKGRVQAGEMLQLTEQGIPAWRYLAESIGVTQGEVMKLSEKGLIPAQQAIDAILAGMEKDFGGMMAEQAKTGAGQFSNLIDKLELLGTTMGKRMLPVVKEGIALLSDLTDVAVTHQSNLDLLDKAVKDGTISQTEYNKQMTNLQIGLPLTQQLLDGLTHHYEEQEQAAKKLGGQMDEGTRTLNGFAMAAGDAKPKVDDLTFSLSELGLAAALKAGMDGELRDAQEEYNEEIEGSAERIRNLKDEIAKLTDQHGQLFTVQTDAKYSLEEFQLAQIKAGEAAQKLAEYTGDDVREHLELKIAADNAAESVARMAGEMGSSTTGVIDNTKKIGELREELTKEQEAQLAAKVAREEATKAFLFQQLAVEGDTKANLDLALALGQLSEADYNAALAAQTLKEEYQKYQDLDTYRDKTEKLRDAILGLQSRDITITVTTIQREITYSEFDAGTRPGAGSTPGGGRGDSGAGAGTTATGGGRAGGGDIQAGRAYRVAEGGRGEIFQSDESGRITPLGPGQSAGGGVSIGSIVINAGPGANGRQLFEEFKVELGRAVRAARTGGYAFLGAS